MLAFQFIDTTFQRIKELKLEKNEIQDRLNTQKRLAIYNNTYWRPFLGPNKEKYIYNSVGIRFNTDLVSRSKEKDRVNALHNQIDVKRNEEVIFNNQKELSNFLLEYHSKLRTYSRYAHKLKALIEDKRLESAIQFVNYEGPQSNLKTLNIDLDRLSVEYELLELKQQLYILILKIFKKANISSLLPYVKERIITKDNNKLKGSRLIVLDGNYSKTNEHAFLTEYLAKNEFFDIILKQDNYTNNDFKTALEIKGFRIYDDPDALSYRNIVNIPLENFNNRIEMEYWIGDNYSGDDNTLYLVSNLNQLLSIDSFTLDD